MAEALRMLYAVLLVVSGVASICGNVLLLLMLLLYKELRADTLGLTLSFSLSDLALGLSTIPFGAHNSLTWPARYPSEGALCQGSGFIFLLLQTSSIHSLAWATVDKFTEICFALTYRNIWTAGRSRVVLVVVWSFCLLNAVLPLLGFGSYTYSESRFLCCPSFTPDNRYFVVLWMLAGIVAPILTMCSLYGYIVYVARKQARRGTFMCNELHCFYVPANNYLRSSIVMVTTSGELILRPDWSLTQATCPFCLYKLVFAQTVQTHKTLFYILVQIQSFQKSQIFQAELCPSGQLPLQLVPLPLQLVPCGLLVYGWLCCNHVTWLCAN